MKKHGKFPLICLTVLGMASVVRYTDDSNSFLTDVLSHFPFQYALLSLALMSYCLWKKRAALAVMAGILFFFNAFAIMDLGGPTQAAGPVGKTFKVYSSNLHIHNTSLLKLNSELRKMDPEMVLLMEVTPEHLEQLRPVMQNYPYHVEKIFDGERAIGFVFLSRFPIIDYHVERLSEVCNFVLDAKVEIDRKQVMFYGLHALRPGLQNLSERKEQFSALAHRLKEETLPVIAAGDFNATPFSPLFRQLLRISELRDSRAGFGWQPSWPTHFPLLWIPIDHMVLSPEIQIHQRATGSYIGSDHYPIFAELSIQN